MQIVGERMKEAMRRVGLAQNKDLAQAVGVDPSQVSRWIRHGNLPEAKTLIKLCLALRCSRAYLLGLERDKEYLQLLQLEVQEVLGPAAEALMRVALAAIERRAPDATFVSPAARAAYEAAASAARQKSRPGDHAATTTCS